MTKNKFYVVWSGRETGVFTDWTKVYAQIDKFPKARYKSFPNLEEAEEAFAAGSDTRPAPSKMRKAQKGEIKPVTNNEYDVTIYCDGGCEPNPGLAGSGVAVYSKGELSQLWYGLFNPAGTNNSAELNALYQSFVLAEKAIAEQQSVIVRCDSKYAIDCVTNWAYGWKSRGWTKKGGEIRNLELVKQAHALFDSLKDKVIVEHVKAHVGIEGNELADRMSIYAVEQKATDFCAYKAPFNIAEVLALRNG